MTGPSATQAETVLNGKLGELLINRHPRWNEHNVFIDSTHVLRDHPAEKIDVLVAADGGQPVAIEAKFKPNASQLRKQVEGRLGKVVKANGLEIEAAVSVVCPEGLSAGQLERAELSLAIHQAQPDGTATRWPEQDGTWLSGTVDDVADVVEVLTLSERLVQEGGNPIVRGRAGGQQTTGCLVGEHQCRTQNRRGAAPGGW